MHSQVGLMIQRNCMEGYMNFRNEEKIVGAFQNLILSIASVFYIYAMAMLLELIHKYF